MGEADDPDDDIYEGSYFEDEFNDEDECTDICPNCDGTGERDFISGAKCLRCNGKGMI